MKGSHQPVSDFHQEKVSPQVVGEREATNHQDTVTVRTLVPGSLRKAKAILDRQHCHREVHLTTRSDPSRARKSCGGGGGGET